MKKTDVAGIEPTVRASFAVMREQIPADVQADPRVSMQLSEEAILATAAVAKLHVACVEAGLDGEQILQVIAPWMGSQIIAVSANFGSDDGRAHHFVAGLLMGKIETIVRASLNGEHQGIEAVQPFPMVDVGDA